MINIDRMAGLFRELVAIDSISREEAHLAGFVQQKLEKLGAAVTFDDAGAMVGGNSGNLIARMGGNQGVPVMLLNAHMDTVEPGRGIRTVVQDGRITSAGNTILGADDKSAVAIILEVLQVVQENRLPHAPFELVFTVCEEIGLLGARHLDFDRLTATFGYTLDSSYPDAIVNRAPSANRIEIQVHGKDAHAGSAPEKGVNAIWLAGKAIADLQIGRIDDETTCNIGIIEGGIATNVVPDLVTLKGEVRSHDELKLAAQTETIVRAFESVIEPYEKMSNNAGGPRLDVKIEKDFGRTHIPEDHAVVRMARQAAENLGRTLICKTSGGGADANIFFEKGIHLGVLGTGMRDVHTVRESIRIDDMAASAELLLEIIRLHAGTQTTPDELSKK